MKNVTTLPYKAVERARQKLVLAEEAYLYVHGWKRTKVGQVWMWERPHVPPGSVVMHRSDAVYFQHTKIGDDS